jgi:hypothetical protein
MKRNHRKLIALLALLLLVGLAGGTILWLRSEQREYVLNRQLIAALVQDDDKRALALVNAGAGPNTRYAPMPVPSFLQLWNQLITDQPCLPTTALQPL